MSLYQLKSQFQNRLRPLSDTLVAHEFTANQVTVSAVFLSLGTAYIIAKPAQHQPRLWLLLPTSLFIRIALNATDGMMAREHGQVSTLGAWLNEAGDIVADSALIASLSPHLNKIERLETSSYVTSNFITLSVSTELLAIVSSLSFDNRANQGPLGKSDRALLLGVVGVWMGTKLPLLPLSTLALKPLLLLTQALLIKTCLNRLRFIAELYLLRNPPIAKLENIVKNNASCTAIHFLESNLMPTAPLATDTANQSSNNTNEPIPHEVINGESCYNAYDGTAIYYRYWLTMPLAEIKKASQPLRQVVLLHRGHEHSGRLAELGEQFTQAGYQVFAWDARGNGRSGGIKDHAKSVTELERDLNDFVQLVIAQTSIAIEDTLIVASSIGAVLAAAWVHDYAPNIRGMILGTPALSIRLYMPFAIPSLKVARALGLMSRVSSYVKAQVLTHDEAAQQAYNADPLISGSISTDLLIDTHATGQRLLDDAAAISVPTFIMCAGKDYVVDKQAEREFYEALNIDNKRWKLYPDSYHAIFHETNKAEVFADCIEFAEQVFSVPLQTTDLRCAHINSASKDKVDRLAIKPFNPSFAITRFAMQKFGHVSDAIATGLEHGFDSGHSLDHVYYNEPSGKGGLGRAVDKFYLSNIGWQGIRIRREHILELAGQALKGIEANDKHINNQTSAPQEFKLLDIASGHGFYAFDLLTKFDNLQAELRDYDPHNIQALQAKAQRLAIDNRVTACQKDAFDLASYQETKGKESFDIAITSGVFELFSDNTLPATALAGIYDSLKDNGYLLYTNQPWHPEQEFISKTLNNHRGSDWVMRCRSQAEMDQLVAKAGFEKIAMRIDKFGIFTVSLAKKRQSIANKPVKQPQVNS